MKDLWDRMRVTIQRGIRWGDNHVPRGLRSVLGVLLMCGGVVGFLPILGFWMLPLGMALIALDIAPLRRRVLAWADRDHACMNSRSD
jgi:hypothetical protein